MPNYPRDPNETWQEYCDRTGKRCTRTGVTMNSSEWELLKYVVARNNTKAGTFIRDVLLSECEPYRDQFERETGITVNSEPFDKVAHFSRVGKQSAVRSRALTAEQVLAMDGDRERGMTWGQIARKYKVSKATCRSAVNRVTYTDVPKKNNDDDV